jgi:Na+/H+ antiporter NhaA
MLAIVLGIALFALERRGLRSRIVFTAVGLAMWVALHGSGVSPTLAGVALGLLTPAVPRQRPAHVSREAHRVADETVDDPHPPDADAGQWLALSRLSREAVSPLSRLEQVLHPWTSYAIVPLFVLAEAGVSFAEHVPRSAPTTRVAVGLVIARVLGKPIGILGAGWLVERTGIGSVPSELTGRQLLGAAAAAGAPFSVSLFVGELAFRGDVMLDAVRVGVIGATVLAGFASLLILRGAEGAVDPPRT